MVVIAINFEGQPVVVMVMFSSPWEDPHACLDSNFIFFSDSVVINTDIAA